MYYNSLIIACVLLFATTVLAHPQRQSSGNGRPTRRRTTTTTSTTPAYEDVEEEGGDDDDDDGGPIDTSNPALLEVGVPRQGCKGALDELTDEEIQYIIDTKPLYKFYKACILGNDVNEISCTCVGWELRRIMSGLLSPSLCPAGRNLPYCPTPEQKKRGQEFMKQLSSNDNQTWKDVLKKYGGKGSS